MKASQWKKVATGTTVAIAILGAASTSTLAMTVPFQANRPLAQVFEQFTSQLGVFTKLCIVHSL